MLRADAEHRRENGCAGGGVIRCRAMPESFSLPCSAWERIASTLCVRSLARLRRHRMAPLILQSSFKHLLDYAQSWSLTNTAANAVALDGGPPTRVRRRRASARERFLVATPNLFNTSSFFVITE